MSTIEYRLVVVKDGEEVLSEPLSCDLMTTIAGSWPDSERWQNFYKYAAQHPSAQVRQIIARKDKISEETCQLLKEDQSLAVLSELLNSSAFREIATLDLLENYLQKHPDLADVVARNLESYKLIDAQKLSEILIQNKDTYVLYTLASNRRTPKKILKELLSHPDPAIAESARESYR